MRVPLDHPWAWLWPASLWMTTTGARGHWGDAAAYHRVLTHWYLPGLGAAFLGCLGRSRIPRRDEGEGSRFLKLATLRVLLVAILSLAVFFRLWGVWEWPPPGGLGLEEPQMGAVALGILDRWSHPNEHRVPSYLVSLSFALFGRNILALRLPFILIGALCPALLYWMCRKLVSREVSLFVLALFSVSWWQIAASRVADEVFLPIAIEILVVGLLAEFVSRPIVLTAFWLALCSGLLIYEYTGYQVAWVLVFAYVLSVALRSWLSVVKARRPRGAAVAGDRWSGRHLLGVAGLGVVWLNVGMAQIVGDASLGRHFFLEGLHRHRASGCGALAVPRSELASFAWDRLGTVAAAAFVPGKGDPSSWLNAGRHPMLDGATFLLLLLSIAVVAATPRRLFHGWLLLWLALVFFVGSVFPCNVSLMRFYAVLPVVYLLIALGCEVVWTSRLMRGHRSVLLVLAIVAGAVAAMDNLSHFFVRLSRDPFVREAYWDPRVTLSRWIADREPAAQIWWLSDQYPELGEPSDYSWLQDHRSVHAADSISAIIPAPERDSRVPGYYLVLSDPPQAGIGTLLRAYYPGVTGPETIDLGPGQPRAQAFRVPPAAASGSPPGHPSGGGMLRLRQYTTPPDTSAVEPGMPSSAEVLSDTSEAAVSVLALPLRLKRELEASHDPRRELWQLWQGEFASEVTERARVRLVVRSGTAWLRLNGGQAVQLEAGTGQAASRLVGVPVHRGANALWLLYRFAGQGPAGVQLTRAPLDGPEALLLAMAKPEREVWLSELTPLLIEFSLAAPRNDETWSGEPMMLGGIRFARGVGTHSTTRLQYAVPKDAMEFRALAGLTDGIRSCPAARVGFEVRSADGRLLFETGPIDGRRPQTEVQVVVQGLDAIVLAVKDGGNGPDCDHANWAGARFVLKP